jgi:CheY-like chemotaxis protein
MIDPAMLVITADPDIAREAMESVDGGGCRVRVRESVPDAVKDIESVPGIALLLLDASLALDDGPALIRATAQGADLPMLMLHPNGLPHEDRAADPAAMADGFVTRPLHGPTLLAWVHMAERLRRLLHAGHEEAKDRIDRYNEPLLRTAALSHAISGPLQNISAAADLLELALPPDFEEEAQLHAIRRNLQRAVEIVRAASDEARHALKHAGHDA